MFFIMLRIIFEIFIHKNFYRGRDSIFWEIWGDILFTDVSITTLRHNEFYSWKRENFSTRMCFQWSSKNFLFSPSVHNILGGGQNLERRNVGRPVFRNFEIANIKMKKNELFDNFIFEFFFHFLETIWTPKLFNNFWYCKILIFQMVKLRKILNFPNC